MASNILTGPSINFTVESSLGQFFFDSSEKCGPRICQIDSQSNTQESFSSVKQRSTRVALALQQKGVTFEDVIVTCSSVTLDTIIPILASLYIGARVANLDTSLSIRQTTHLLNLVSPRVIFVEESSLSRIEESLTEASFNAIIVVFGKSQKYATFSDLEKPQENEHKFKPLMVNIHDTALMLFSSGTTGLPKAICHSHYSFMHNVRCVYDVIKSDAILFFTSFYWISAMWMLTCSFMAGGYIIINKEIEAENILRIIEKYKVTCLSIAPILTYKLTDFPKWQDYDTSTIYTVLTGSTPISPTQFRRVANLFHHSNIIFIYGCSEAGMVSSFNPQTDHQLIKSKTGSSGKAALGVNIKIVSLETNEAVGSNQKGEICVKTPALMKGYYGIDNNFDIFDRDGYFKTGDVGYYDNDHCLYMIKRIKDMFKYLSWHIVPTSIETVLMEHPAVEEAAVFGMLKTQEIGEEPAACVVLKTGFSANKEEIEEFVAARVSDREKLRGGVFFVEKLLRTPSGKLMRKEIRESIINN